VQLLLPAWSMRKCRVRLGGGGWFGVLSGLGLGIHTGCLMRVWVVAGRWGVLSPAGGGCSSARVVSGGCWWGLSAWLSLENCTVDASISRCIAGGLVTFGWGTLLVVCCGSDDFLVRCGLKRVLQYEFRCCVSV
jgi:hypothetical protein